METYIHVNSTNRNTSLYPSGNNFSLYLPTTIKNIIKAEVIAARVPNTVYYLNTTTNLLTTTGTSSMLMPPGFYADPVAFATEISNRFTSTSAEKIIWVPAEGKFLYLTTAAVGSTFNVIASDFGLMIGTPVGNYTTVAISTAVCSSATSTNFTSCFKSPSVVDMTRNDFMFLNIAELNHNNFKDPYGTNPLVSNVSQQTTGNTTGLFTAITMDVTSNTVKTFKNSDYPIAVYYDPPISSIDRISISWYDYRRNLINFQGFEDNAVILRITSSKPPGPLNLGDVGNILEGDVDNKSRSLPPPPLPKIIKEKKTWGRWFILLVIGALVTLWISKKRAAWPGP
jgi:hypothetical protein